ncbi:MAG: phosphohistidine phosphatase SixA [Cyanobacteria bacterium P01_H01_bin.15]
MGLYFIRHGIAVERTEFDGPDAQRPLTEKGWAKTTQVANKLLTVGLQFDYLFCSPLARAQQTAEIFGQAGLGIAQTLPELSPGGDFKLWLARMERISNLRLQEVGLVGHQPDLSEWAERLLWGRVRHQVELKKAGILGLRLPLDDPWLGHSTLILLAAPKWLC